MDNLPECQSNSSPHHQSKTDGMLAHSVRSGARQSVQEIIHSCLFSLHPDVVPYSFLIVSKAVKVYCHSTNQSPRSICFSAMASLSEFYTLIFLSISSQPLLLKASLYQLPYVHDSCQNPVPAYLSSFLQLSSRKSSYSKTLLQYFVLKDMCIICLSMLEIRLINPSTEHTSSFKKAELYSLHQIKFVFGALLLFFIL